MIVTSTEQPAVTTWQNGTPEHETFYLVQVRTMSFHVLHWDAQRNGWCGGDGPRLLPHNPETMQFAEILPFRQNREARLQKEGKAT